MHVYRIRGPDQKKCISLVETVKENKSMASNTDIRAMTSIVIKHMCVHVTFNLVSSTFFALLSTVPIISFKIMHCFAGIGFQKRKKYRITCLYGQFIFNLSLTMPVQLRHVSILIGI